MPFESGETLGLKVLKSLIKWDWGMRAVYANSKAVQYILGRAPRAKILTEKKFRLVEQTLKSKYFLKSSEIIDPVIGAQLEVYYSQGVYGTEGGTSYVPEYASKSM